MHISRIPLLFCLPPFSYLFSEMFNCKLVWERPSCLNSSQIMVFVLLPLGTELDVSICIVFFLQKRNCLLFMFQVEKEDVQREKEVQCICIPKTFTVAMVLLVLRYIHYFCFKAQAEFSSCPVARQCFLSVFVVCELVCRYHCSVAGMSYSGVLTIL